MGGPRAEHARLRAAAWRRFRGGVRRAPRQGGPGTRGYGGRRARTGAVRGPDVPGGRGGNFPECGLRLPAPPGGGARGTVSPAGPRGARREVPSGVTGPPGPCRVRPARATMNGPACQAQAEAGTSGPAGQARWHPVWRPPRPARLPRPYPG
ncbi:collagen alpha-1(I) chain-like [Lutra lutra]|uniref:collagen alpha-1(I) chain-like n=1 Tax=Lutra lutra TaxID=9657 RepID=UPI001FD50DCD|nr:collagen alpha-1(I) chain-like [Lutra lutra]